MAVVHFHICHLWTNFTATIRQRLGIAPNGGDLVYNPQGLMKNGAWQTILSFGKVTVQGRAASFGEGKGIFS